MAAASKSGDESKRSMIPSSAINVSKQNMSQNNPQSMMSPMAPAASKNEVGDPVIQNVVSTVNLGTELNLMRILARTKHSEYNPARFSGLITKILEPRTTALIFSSGKIVCTGARSEEDSFLATRKFARILQKLGFPVKFFDFKIQNIVATCDVKFPIKLENMYQKHNQFSCYEPELYPGLIYRMLVPKVVLLIFVNGKIVLTGAKSKTELKDAMINIIPVLKSYRKQ